MSVIAPVFSFGLNGYAGSGLALQDKGGPLCHSQPGCDGYLETDKRPTFLSRYQCRL
jgi:hypothetical protein